MVHHSTNDSLNNGHCHDAFSAFCELEHKGDMREAVKAAAAMLGMSAKSGDKTTPKRAEVAPHRRRNPPWPSVIRGFGSIASAALGVDDSMLLLGMLTAGAGMIGNTRTVRIRSGWDAPCALYAGVVAHSGNQKTPMFKLLTGPMETIQSESFRDHMDALEEHERDRQLYEKELAEWKRNKKGGEPPERPVPPVCARLTIGDCTVEALMVLLSENPKGLFRTVDELATIVGGFNRYSKGGGVGGDESKYLSFYNGTSETIDRKSGGDSKAPKTIYVPRPLLSIFGCVQPGTARRMFTLSLRENGLLPRFIWVMPKRTRRKWRDDFIPVSDLEWWERIVRNLRMLNMSQRRDAKGRALLEPVPVELSAEARSVYRDYVNTLGERQYLETGLLAAALAKMEETAARIALVIHFLRWADDENSVVETIDETTMHEAVDLAWWLIDELERVYATLDGDEQTDAKHALLDHIADSGGRISVKELQHHGLRAYRDHGAAQSALQSLVDAGLGRWDYERPGPTGGRPSRQFVLTTAGRGDGTETPENNAENGGFVATDGRSGDPREIIASSAVLDALSVSPEVVTIEGEDGPVRAGPHAEELAV